MSGGEFLYWKPTQRGWIHDYYIKIKYKNKSKKIGIIKWNDAYDVLRKLLKIPNTKIPIDIYVYKNKVYADLESVDLTQVEGYDKVIQKMEEEEQKWSRYGVIFILVIGYIYIMCMVLAFFWK